MNKIFLMMSIIGTLLFAFGIHSIDTGYNLNTINRNSAPSNYVDISISGLIQTSQDMYRNGLLEIIAGFLLTMLSLICISNYKKNRDLNSVEMQ